MPRSTFYHKQKITDKREQDAARLKHVERIVLHHPRYGSPRVARQLRREGIKINRKVVERLMHDHGLIVNSQKKFVRTTDSNHPYPIYPNLKGNFIPTGLNQLWVADITYVRLQECFCYLAVILDAYSRRAVGYAISMHIDRELTLAALKMAVLNRKPPAGCIHHSDRGVQYAAEDYTDLLKSHGFQISMSRTGNPYDNAMAESFMKTLKYEEVYLSEYRSFEDAVQNIFRFIEEVYNKRRLHSGIGYTPPVEFEENLTGGGDVCKILKLAA